MRTGWGIRTTHSKSAVLEEGHVDNASREAGCITVVVIDTINVVTAAAAAAAATRSWMVLVSGEQRCE